MQSPSTQRSCQPKPPDGLEELLQITGCQDPLPPGRLLMGEVHIAWRRMDSRLLSRPTCQHPSASQFSETALTHQADAELQHFPRRAMCVLSEACQGPAAPGYSPLATPRQAGGGFWTPDKASSLSLPPDSDLQEVVAPQLGSLAGCSALIEMSPQRSQQKEAPSVHLPCLDMRLD